MKMPEKHDLLAAILAAKEQGIGAIPAFAMAYLRGRYNGGVYKTEHATMCAIIACSFVTFLDFAGLSSNLAYITSVFIGYIGITPIGSSNKRFAVPEKMVEINNQCKAFLDMLAVGGELITDVRKPEIMVMTSL